ncbi:SPOR domain-containing protein [Pseudoxanthomonas wuyuanensis]|uniref:Cell division protein FtsN n=1 Tax=Pseudoxanthomonas wuyuanensis TaxID=1073196 RepID=A0A286D8B7_9GAMM|nr:SPOR domain-containing protein [Pseudoxanthomonas wuyuanensis]KAF1718832.1 sporulation protein [Pseudoxanthomonas wuyuanensis]SOD54847.1 Cell division protein FtsN [Pseudoxanthomonas wuyuanensis]
MAARRGKSQARRNSSSHATPAWVWLVLGLLIGAGAFFIFKNDGGNFNPLRPQPNPDARPAQVNEADVEAVASETAAPVSAKPAPAKETQYDFYTLLPGKEVQLSDAELAASAREEEARRARAALNGTPLNAPAMPAPIAETPAAPPSATPAPAATPASPAAAPATATTVAGAGNGARYILQAGAFGASGDAEATKAKIAMLGLSARVEAAQINDKTVYRVRMGPYGTASELADAKQKLASSGLPAMAIKAQ